LSKSHHFEHSRSCHWQTVLELRVLSLFQLSHFTFLESRIHSISFPGLLASPASSFIYGGAFRERHGENVTHSQHHSHMFPFKSHLYIHFSYPLQNTLFSSQSFILWKPNFFFWCEPIITSWEERCSITTLSLNYKAKKNPAL
jgi:hypothetical protein